MFPADLEVNTWWTNTDMTDEDVITQYHAYGERGKFRKKVLTG